MADRYYTNQYTGDKIITWKNFTDTSTPLSAANLQKSHSAINAVDQSVRAAFNSVDNTKLDKTSAASMISDIEFNQTTGVLIFHHYDTSISDIVFNTNLQKVVVNFTYDEATQSLVLTQADNTVVRIDLSAFISTPDVANSDTVAWTINQDGSVSADIIDGSITEDKLEEHYLESILDQVATVIRLTNNSEYFSKLAKSYANGTSNLSDRPNENVDNSKYYMEQSQRSAIICGSILHIAGQNASDSEAYGAGTRDGEPVSSDDPAYHNNSKYYMEEAKEAVIEHLPVMTGATATTDGQQGAAPKPLAGQQDDLLTGGAQYKSLDELGIQKRVLASTLTIGGQVVTEVEEALNALNEKPAVNNYNDLQNKPQINGNTLSGNKTGAQLGLQNIVLSSALSIGGQTVTEVEEALQALNEKIGGTDNYPDLQNKPQVNGNTLVGNKTGSQLGLQNIVLASALTIGGQEITEVEPALRALNEKGGGHTILDEDGNTYPQRSKLQFEGCEITDDAVNDTTIVKCEGGGVKKYAKPTITVGTYTYDGTTQAPTITGFDANVMTLTGTYEAINAGSYTFTIALSDKTSSKWTDDTQDDIVTTWSINAISVAVPTVTNTTKTYNGSAQSPTITRDTASTSVSGTTSATKVKSNYSFSIALTDTTNHKWSDNTTAAKSYTWKINPPTGSSYTPVNNIQAWLQCASIDKSYTTIAQVLADATTLSALMLSNNAVDYLVRSTSWVSNITGNQTAMTDIGASDYCADTLLANSTWRTAICNSTYFESVLNVKVPVMTSNTTPSGECFKDTPYNADTTYHAFDGVTDTATYVYHDNSISNEYHYIGYKFNSPVKVYCMEEYFPSHGTHSYISATTKIQGSNDNSTYTDLSEETYTPSQGTRKTIITNPGSYLYYRKNATAYRSYDYNGRWYYWSEYMLQFYGRASS